MAASIQSRFVFIVLKIRVRVIYVFAKIPFFSRLSHLFKKIFLSLQPNDLKQSNKKTKDYEKEPETIDAIGLDNAGLGGMY
jgi:hypothetical protein